jgi:hypothetical protein
VIQAGVFILRSVLKVTQRVQRVPPACIIKQQMPRTVTDPSVGTFRVRVGGVGRRWFVEPRHAHGTGAEGAVRAGKTVVARTLVTGAARTLNVLTSCHYYYDGIDQRHMSVEGRKCNRCDMPSGGGRERKEFKRERAFERESIRERAFEREHSREHSKDVSPCTLCSTPGTSAPLPHRCPNKKWYHRTR